MSIRDVIDAYNYHRKEESNKMAANASIVSKIIQAVDNYAEFKDDDVGEAVSEALIQLRQDLIAGGYEQSSLADDKEDSLEDAMSEAAKNEEEDAE